MMPGLTSRMSKIIGRMDMGGEVDVYTTPLSSNDAIYMLPVSLA
jgi:hypothetical protein